MFSGTVEELKLFMSVLLRGELFDSWEVTEAKVETFFELSVNGEFLQTLTYSVNSYAYAMQDNANMKALANALYNYGVAAKAYTA